MKSVQFNLDNTIFCYTYSNEEYDRYPIDSIMYLRCYNKVSDFDWINMLENLNLFKICEMIVHKNSLNNTRIH
jgi:hypothetical protein